MFATYSIRLNLFLKILVFICLPAVVYSTAGADEGIEESIHQYVQLRKLISTERQAWELEQLKLTDLIQYYKEEIEVVDQQMDSLEGEMESGSLDLVGVKTKIETIQHRLNASSIEVNTWEKKADKLLALLPAQIRDDIMYHLSAQTVQVDDIEQITLSERMDTLCETLRQINDFNATITKTTEIHELDDGTEVAVEVLYFGFGFACCVSQTGRLAGYARPTSDHWVWEYDKTLAGVITQAIAIHEGNAPAAYVSLPINAPDLLP